MTRAVALLRDRLARWWPPAIVFAILVASISYRVTPNRGILTYGDYPYYWPDRAFDGLSVVQSSFLGYIRLVGLQTAIVSELPRLLSTVLPHSWTGYLLTYGLLYTTALTYYFVVSRLTDNSLIGYVAGSFIVLNNVVLEYLVVQPSHIFASLIVYALTFHIFMKARGRFRARHALAIGLLTLALTHPFFWALEMVLVVALFVFLFSERRRIIGPAILTFTLIVGLAAYWIVPFVVGTLSSSTADLYAGNQNSVFEGVKAKVHYLEAFGLFQYPGTWQKAIYSGRLPYAFDFAVVAFVVAVFALWGRRGESRRLFLFLLTLYVVTLTLGLGPNSSMTGTPWRLAYDHIPGFGFFRTFSRTFTLSLVTLVLLVAVAFQQLHRQGRHFRRVAGLFLGVVILSHTVFFTGDLNGTTTAARVPKDYAALNARLLRDPGEYSVVTYPNIYYEAYRWGINRNLKAYQQITYFKELFLYQPVIFNRLALDNLNLSADFLSRLFAYDHKFSFYPTFDEDLNKVDAKYVLIHKDLFDIVKVINNLANLKSNAEAHQVGIVPYEWYMAYFSNSANYQLVENNLSFAVYENKLFRPLIRSEETSFQRVSDTTYRIHLAKLDGKRDLVFLRRFDEGWQLYPQRDRPPRPCKRIRTFDGTLTECSKEGGGLDWKEGLRALGGGALRVPHQQVLGYANQWRLDAATLRRQLSNEYYTLNDDGSIDIDLVIYFRPQSYFSVGLLVTSLSLLICLLVGALSAIRYMALRK